MKRAMPQNKPALTIFTLSALAVLLWSPPVFALDPSLDISQYAHTTWTFQNGFSHGAVYAIAQTADGYLWLGTQSGVFRFDGVRMTPLPLAPGQQLRTTEVGSLLPARDGTLWIGTLDGLLSWKNGQLTEHPAFRGLRINALLQDRDGDHMGGDRARRADGKESGQRACHRSFGYHLGCYRGRVAALDPQHERFTTYYESDGLPSNSINAVLEDHNGNLWVSTAAGLSRFNPRKKTFVNYDEADGLTSDNFEGFPVAYQTRSGQMFFGNSRGLTFILAGPNR